MTVTVPACIGCKRKTTKWNEDEACEAFPNGIPDKIKWGQDGHMAPMPDGSDGGLFFDPVEGFEFFRDEWWANGAQGGVLASDSFTRREDEAEETQRWEA